MTHGKSQIENSRGRANTVSGIRPKIEMRRDVYEQNYSFSDGIYIQSNGIWFENFSTSNSTSTQIYPLTGYSKIPSKNYVRHGNKNPPIFIRNLVIIYRTVNSLFIFKSNFKGNSKKKCSQSNITMSRRFSFFQCRRGVGIIGNLGKFLNFIVTKQWRQ